MAKVIDANSFLESVVINIASKWRIETIRDISISVPFLANSKGWLIFIPDEEIKNARTP